MTAHSVACAVPTVRRTVRRTVHPTARRRSIMVWQFVLGGFLVLLPFALLFDLHPHRERSDARGLPIRREWRSDLTGPART